MISQHAPSTSTLWHPTSGLDFLGFVGIRTAFGFLRPFRGTAFVWLSTVLRGSAFSPPNACGQDLGFGVFFGRYLHHEGIVMGHILIVTRFFARDEWRSFSFADGSAFFTTGVHMMGTPNSLSRKGSEISESLSSGWSASYSCILHFPLFDFVLGRDVLSLCEG